MGKKFFGRRVSSSASKNGDSFEESTHAVESSSSHALLGKLGRSKGAKASSSDRGYSKDQGGNRSLGEKIERRKVPHDKAKRKTEANRSIRRIKRNDEVRSMLQQFPRGSNPNLTRHDPEVEEDELEVDGGGEEEPIYSSRKLMIRHMQSVIAKRVREDGDEAAGVEAAAGSGYDSWSDLEESFAVAYEPIPLHIHLDTWRKMTKNDILKTVRSKKMREDFAYMSLSEILRKIEVMQKSAKYLSAKFGVDELLPGLGDEDDRAAAAVLVATAEVHSSEVSGTEDSDSVNSSAFTNNTNNPKYLSRSEILKVYEEVTPLRDRGVNSKNNDKARSKVVNGVRRHDSWSSCASSIMKNPQGIYVSREEVLKNLKKLKAENHPPPPHRSQAERKPHGIYEVNPTRREVTRNEGHGSWSSRASSFIRKGLNSAENGENIYVSRAEVLEKLADFA